MSPKWQQWLTDDMDDRDDHIKVQRIKKGGKTKEETPLIKKDKKPKRTSKEDF